MHIRQLARNAAFITIAATVTGGFATGIAQATNVAPASTVPAVAHGGTTPRVNMPSLCTTGVCTLGLAGGPHPFEYIIQRWNCTITIHGGIITPIYGVVNNCSTRVWTHAQPPKPICISPHSTKAGVGRFGNVTNVQVTFATSNCPAGSG
jgi:hypothetical protein